MRLLICALLLLPAAALPAAAIAQTTRPDNSAAAAATAPAPAQPPSADQLLNQMLRPTDSDKNQVLQPSSPSPTTNSDATASSGILREGTDIVDRTGRLSKSPDGSQEQFVFESDGRALADPPVYILPNLKLMQMEEYLQAANHDLRFRITGTVTEYHGHNYILLEKVVVVQDQNQEF